MRCAPKIDRTDEGAVLAVLAKDPTIIRVGRFERGGFGSYAGARVIRRLDYRTKTEYVVHTAFVVDDDQDQEPYLSFYAGHYFTTYAAARERLEELYPERVKAVTS